MSKTRYKPKKNKNKQSSNPIQIHAKHCEQPLTNNQKNTVTNVKSLKELILFPLKALKINTEQYSKKKHS